MESNECLHIPFQYWKEFTRISELIDTTLEELQEDVLTKEVLSITSIVSEEELRSRLATNDSATNLPVALYLLRNFIRSWEPSSPVASAELDWVLFVLPFAHAESSLMVTVYYFKALDCFRAKNHKETNQHLSLSENYLQATSLDRASLGFIRYLSAEEDTHDLYFDEVKEKFDEAIKVSNHLDESWRNFLLLRQKRSKAIQYFLDNISTQLSDTERISLLNEVKSQLDELFFDSIVNWPLRFALKHDLAGMTQAADTTVWLLGQFNKNGNSTYKNLANICYYNNFFKEAIVTYERYLDSVNAIPDEADIFDHLANCYLQTNQLNEAERIAKKALSYKEDDFVINQLLGRIYLYQENFNQARKYLDRSLQLEPYDPMTRLLKEGLDRADITLKAGYDPIKKTLFFSSDIAEIPEDEAAVHMTVAIMNTLSDEEFFGRLNEVAVSEPPAFMRRLLQLLRLNDEEETDPAKLAYEKAEKLFQARQLPEAIVAYKEVIKLKTDHGLAYMGIGDCLYMMGEFYSAIAFFEESIEIEPHVSTYRFLGDAYKRIGKLGEAIKAYRASLDLDPNYDLGKKSLEIVLEQQKQDQSNG